MTDTETPKTIAVKTAAALGLSKVIEAAIEHDIAATRSIAAQPPEAPSYPTMAGWMKVGEIQGLYRKKDEA